MSADPFRDIVKQNSELYRSSEEAREQHFQKISSELDEWKKEHEVYLRAAKCLAHTENVNLRQIGIFDADDKKS
jgi:hypothetical protein